MLGRSLLFALTFVWAVVLVDDSGPSMADSTLLGAIRVVDDGRFTLVDEEAAFEPKTVFQTRAHDISVYEGRVYSGVGPGASLAAAPFYWALRPVFSLFDEDVISNRRITNYYTLNARSLGTPPAHHFKDLYLLQIAMVVFLVAPLFASLVVRLYSVLLECGAARTPAVVACLATGFGSMALYYSSMYSRQALAYLLVWHAALWLAAPREPGRVLAFAIGLLCGAAVAIEYPSAMLVALVLVFLAPRLPAAQCGLVALPLVVVLGLLALYHDAAFGSFLATPYHHRFWYTPPSLSKMGIDLAAFQPGGTLGINAPSPAVMLRLAFGPYKGLFVYSPILLLGLAGHFVGLRAGRDRRLHLLSLAVFVGYLVYNSTLGTHLPEHAHHFWGGLSELWGPRYLFAVLPFMAWGVVGLDWSRPWVRRVCVAALFVSCLNSVLGAMYSHVMMSTSVFGEELRYPLGYAYSLLWERGPRLSLVDRQGLSPLLQSALLLGLLVASFFTLRRILAEPSDLEARPKRD